FFFLHRTRLGTWMRAVRHDRDTAVAMGIPGPRIYIFTFPIGFSLAPVGGVVAAPPTTRCLPRGRRTPPPSFLSAVRPPRRRTLPGRPEAAILLSFREGVISSVADPTVARISSLVLMSAVLLLRPQGLFKGLTR